MSFLTGSNPGVSQAIISFWFRIPQKSLDAARAAWTGEEGALFDGIVPLVVMGKEGKGYEPTKTDIKSGVVTHTYSYTQYRGGLYDITAECTSVVGFCCTTSVLNFFYDCDSDYISGTYNQGTTYNTEVTGPAPKTDPTYIGVDGWGGLYINFESANVPDVQPKRKERTGYTPHDYSGGIHGQCFDGTKSFGCDVLCCVCLIIECSNDLDNGEGGEDGTTSPPPKDSTYTEGSETFSEVPGDWETSAIYSDGYIDVSADQWHHVLVSVDLKPIRTHGTTSWNSGPMAQYIDSAAKLHVALDDKNYTGWDLADNWTEGDPNEFVSDGGWNIAGRLPGPDGTVQTYSAASAVPSGDIGMPAPEAYVNNVYHCEMAEFQMWTGKTLDTAKEENRRLFLDYKKDSAGKPVPDGDGRLRLKPVDPKVAEEKLGKPNVNLHGSNKWKAGTNLGTGSQFTPTGEIKAYKPDPSVLPAT